MQANHARAFSFSREIARKNDAAVSSLQPKLTLDQNVVECAARALFNFIFARSERLDGNHLWTRCDEATREGFLRKRNRADRKVANWVARTPVRKMRTSVISLFSEASTYPEKDQNT